MVGSAAPANATDSGRQRIGLRRRWRVLAVSWLLLAGGLSHAASALRFTDISGDAIERLGTINALHQDQHGFIWLAAAQGLARYDGYQLKLQTDPANPDTSQSIFAIEADPSDGLWLASDVGLGYLAPDRKQLRILRPSQAGFSDRIQAISPWGDGQWLLGTDSGALIFDPATERFSAVPNTTAFNISALVVDATGSAWLGTRGAGLYQFTSLAERPKRYTQISGLCGDTILTLEVAPGDGALWVGTLGDGVCHLDAGRRGFRTEVVPAANSVWDIHFDHAGGLWLATDRGGLQWRPDRNSDWQVFLPDIHDPDAIGSANLRALFEDRQGNLWASRFPWGISHHHRSTRAITRLRHHPQIASSLTDNGVLTVHHSRHDQSVWIGTERGLNRLDQKGVTRVPGILSDATVLALADAPEGEIWVGTWSQGLLRSSASGEVTAHYLGRGGRGDLSDRFVWSLAQSMSGGEVWAGTEIGGINRIRLDGSVAHWRQADGAAGLPSNFVRTLAQGPQGQWWLGTAAGAAIFDPSDATIRPVGDRHRIRDILMRGTEVWVATQDAGIQIYGVSGAWRGAITSQHMLPSNAVAAIAADPEGHLWAATAAGLARIAEGRVDRVLTRADGLAGNLHNREALLVTPSGRVYAGSTEGLSTFHPRGLDTAATPPLVITDVRIQGRANQPAIAGQSVAGIELAPDENMLAVSFAVLDYTRSDAYQYSYRLMGFDRDWVSAPERAAIFTNLRPGRYRLELRARSPGQPWQVLREGLELEVKAPWWRTPGALLSYLLTLGLAAWGTKRLLDLYYHRRFLDAAAITDPLTGVYNRAGIERVFARLRSDSNRARPTAFILLNIDHFKRINDRRGRETGDRVLVEVAKVLQTSLRHRDAVSRWGSEDFLVVCDGADLLGASRLAERIRAAVAAAPFESHAEPLQVTVSLGVAELKSGEDPAHALARADEALNRAHHSGRNCVIRADQGRTPPRMTTSVATSSLARSGAPGP